MHPPGVGATYKCFGLKVRSDLPQFQLNAVEVGSHGVVSVVEAGLEVPMSKADMVAYYKIVCKSIEGITASHVQLYFDILYSDEDTTVTPPA